MSSTSLRFLRTLLVPLALQAAAPAFARGEGRVKIDITLDVNAESARLVLTHSRRLPYTVEGGAGKIRVRYDEPVELRPAQGSGDPILRRWSVLDEHTLLIETGSAFAAYETFELRNPFRLVLDLRARPQPPSAQKPRERRKDRTKDLTDDRAAPGMRLKPGAIIVLDPGHGGVEQGAVGPSGLIEKDVTLALARRLKQVLERDDRTLQVVLTRDEDELVGLDERAGVANHNRAELFLSIHLNASPRPTARGAETYYLDPHATDEEARILAGLENRAAPGEEERPPPAPGSLDLVLWDLAQNQSLAESGALAESVQRHLNAVAGTPDRGVRQAPFRVLMGATMPAILVEVGFISNPDEEALLQTSAYQDRIVDGLAQAVREYLADVERLSPPAARGEAP